MEFGLNVKMRVGFGVLGAVADATDVRVAKTVGIIGVATTAVLQIVIIKEK